MLLPVGKLHVASIGEVLWDVFGETRHLGGAPFNFAYHCRALGCHAEIASAVGNDQPGRDLVERACEIGVSPRLIQVDPQHPTGTVTVTVDTAGVPTYVIHENVAWDFIGVTYEARCAVAQADVICFGTLAQRSEVTRRTLRALVAGSKPGALRVYDINLRQQFYSAALIADSLAMTNLLKLNEEELDVLAGLFGLPRGAEAVHALLDRFPITGLVVTRGAAGAEAWWKGAHAAAQGIGVEVRDTVGSGDAFAAVFATQVAVGASLENALRYANAAGAYVATQAGATPDISAETISRFARSHP
jgi:fructokinase